MLAGWELPEKSDRERQLLERAVIQLISTICRHKSGTVVNAYWMASSPCWYLQSESPWV
jgi:hypothetical protein